MARKIRRGLTWFALSCVGACVVFACFLYWLMWMIVFSVFLRGAPLWLSEPPFWQFALLTLVAPYVVVRAWRAYA